MQRGKSLLARILYVGSERAQGLHEHPDGALAHTLRAVESHLESRLAGIEGRKETHGGAGGTDIHLFSCRVGECVAHCVGVVTLGHSLERRGPGGEGVDYEGARAHALAQREHEACLQKVFGRKESEIHSGDISVRIVLVAPRQGSVP